MKKKYFEVMEFMINFLVLLTARGIWEIFRKGRGSLFDIFFVVKLKNKEKSNNLVAIKRVI